MDGKSRCDNMDQTGRRNSKTGADTTVVFGIKDGVGALATALKLFAIHDINLSHIESRPSKEDDTEFEVLVQCNGQNGKLLPALDELRQSSTRLQVLLPSADNTTQTVPWFPKKLSDLDIIASQELTYEWELDKDHPGLGDPVYTARRREIANIAYNYKQGEKIPRMEFTDGEKRTWQTLFGELTKLHATHACRKYNDVFPVLAEKCGYRADNIPQLQDISDFLKGRTGFQLRPAAGLMSSRDFLASLAFRVFNCSQFMRHGSRPMYTAEPDMCHEILGHVPLLADPEFASFSQEIGLASLGAPDEYIEKLATCYWFTVEFGVLEENGSIRAYGAGLLSSFGELQHAVSDKPEILPFDPMKAAEREYPVNGYQHTYFLAKSLRDVKDKMTAYVTTIPRDFGMRYNPYTQEVEVLKHVEQISNYATELKHEMIRLEDALKKCSGKP